MKKMLLIIPILFIGFSIFAQQGQSLMNVLPDASRIFNFDSKKVSDVNIVEFSRCGLQVTDLPYGNFDLRNVDLKTLSVVKVDLEDGSKLYSLIAPLSRGGFHNIIYHKGSFIELKISFVDVNSSTLIRVDNTYPIEANATARSWFSRWWSCTTNGVTSGSVGGFISIMGTAGGVGCTACGVVAAATTGFIALGCLAA